jgi:outer membrane protein assembly factor BamB
VIYPDAFNSLLQGAASKVFVVAAKDFEYGTGKILALDIESGQVLWHRSLDAPESIITSNSQLYIALNDKIEILDPQTGNLVKEIQIPNVGPIYNISATENNLYAFTKSGKWLTYDIDSGTHTLSEPFLPYHPFLIENRVMYFYEARELKARETETQSILWAHLINSDFDLVFTDNIIIIRQLDDITGLDKRTGSLLWNLHTHVISNIATDNSYLYFLTNEGNIEVHNLSNGEEVAKLEFVPAAFELDSPSSNNMVGAYNLWADSQNNNLVVSFGDSCQLMSFKIQMP